MSEERIADLAIEFITFCFKRRSVEWPQLYDEMCLVAGNRLYKGLGYEELREAGLDFTLVGLGQTSRIANAVTREMRRAAVA
ncbi:MAG: hypothetical protein HY071_03910 [Chloroflexi bacterium]|nr:hypothetical protein [Chloroflexota bacterium]